jgi:transcriptional regulator with XRE-family HTH domain
MKLGNKLRQLRLDKGYSQEYITHELGMSQSNYCKIESDNHFPTIAVIEKLALLYETNPQAILASEGQHQVQYNQESPNSINAFMVWQDTQKLFEELISSKDKIIALQTQQIESLAEQLKALKGK